MACVVTPESESFAFGPASGSDIGTLADVGITAQVVHELAAADLVQVILEPGDRRFFDKLPGVRSTGSIPALSRSAFGQPPIFATNTAWQSLMARMMVVRLSSSPNPPWQYRSTRRWPTNLAPAVDSS